MHNSMSKQLLAAICKCDMLIEIASIGFTIDMLLGLQMVTKCTYLSAICCHTPTSTVVPYVIHADELMHLTQICLDMIDHPKAITLANLQEHFYGVH